MSLPQSGQQTDPSQAASVFNQRNLLRRCHATQYLGLHSTCLGRGVLIRIQRHAAMIPGVPLQRREVASTPLGVNLKARKINPVIEELLKEIPKR